MLRLCKKHAQSSSGSVALTAVVASTLMVMGLTGLNKLAQDYAKTRAQNRKATQAQKENEYFLNLLVERFRTVDGQTPFWSLEPYPTALQLNNPTTPYLPRIAVARMATTSTVASVATDINGATFQLDETGMGAVENLPSSQNTELQSALLAVGDPSQFTTGLSSVFFGNPNSLWPTNPLTPSQLLAMNKAEVRFLSLTSDSTFPMWAKELLVEITPSGVTNPKRTKAILKLDAPPVPRCRLELAPGYQAPFYPGSQARFRLKSDSIINTANITADNFQSYQTLSNLAGQSLLRVGQFDNIAAEVSFDVPASPFPGNMSGQGMLWTIQAKVRGVASYAEDSCTTTVQVASWPAPVCTLTATPSRPGFGQYSLITLDCQNPVTSASIDGHAIGMVPTGSNSSQGTGAIQKVLVGNQTVTALATGPGGSASPATTLGANCRYIDPNYQDGVATPWGAVWASRGPRRQFIWNGVFQYSYHGAGFWPLGGAWENHVACNANEICMVSRCLLGNENCDYWSGVNPFSTWTNAYNNSFFIKVTNANDESCPMQFYLRGSSGCFVEGTQIEMENQTRIPIETVTTGMWVWNPITSAPVRVSKVVAGPEPLPLWKVVTTSGVVRVTQDHPFLTHRGLMKASQLVSGDFIAQEKITSVEKETQKQDRWVWNIELEGKNEEDHFVLANGIVSGDLFLQKQLKLPRRKTRQVLP